MSEEVQIKENYTSDHPVAKSKDDKFQRYNFAKRIAATIVQRQEVNSIVIGIYGTWGEGKTSVMNFIEEELISDNNIVICKFNPWKYSDEHQMLSAFISVLANQLGKSVVSHKEKIIQEFCKYGEAFSPSIYGIGTKPIFSLWNKKIVPDLEGKKKRIQNILLETRKKIVILIDDIDRLDRREIQSVFKLIKLTADFNYTNYILAFDPIIVSKAIGENYEDGGEMAGMNFLEKIVQVPLRLPNIQESALKNYCLEQVNNAINSNNIDIGEDDVRRFVREFTDHFLPSIKTPRMAIRFGNAISFSLPMLFKEINLGDLMLLEAIKVFYPEVYDFIRDNKSYFNRSYESGRIGADNKKNEERRDSAKKGFEVVVSKYSKSNRESLKELLMELFPFFAQVYRNMGYGEGSIQKWHNEKRIASPQYFSRYFSLVVIKGEISDADYEEFIDRLRDGTEEEMDKSVNEYLSKVDTSSLIFKMLLFKSEQYTPELSKKIISSFAKYGDRFSFNRNELFGFATPLGQLASLISKLLLNLIDKSERFELANKFISECSPFSLAYEFFRGIEYKSNKEVNETSFDEEEIIRLSKSLLEKARNESGGEPLFDKFPHEASFLLSNIWFSTLGKDDVSNYVIGILSKTPEKLSSLLKSYSPYGVSSNVKYPFFTLLKEDTFSLINDTLKIESLFNTATKIADENFDFNKYHKLEGEPSDKQRVEQFIYLYKKQKSDSLKAEEPIGMEN